MVCTRGDDRGQIHLQDSAGVKLHRGSQAVLSIAFYPIEPILACKLIVTRRRSYERKQEFTGPATGPVKSDKMIQEQGGKETLRR